MSCNNCNLKKCGCADSYLTTPPPCPTPSDCAEAQPCSEVFSAECVLYTGLPITCGDVDVVITNTPVSDALASITSFFCDQLATNEDVLCGLDIVVPADTQLEDALPLIVTYFCDVIAALPAPVNPCGSPNVPTPNPPGFIDSVLMCREGELGTEAVQIEWADLLVTLPDTNTWDMAAVAFVSPVGDDFSGVVGDGNLPYGTVQQAAINSNMVIIKPGTYNEQIPLRDGVTYYFMPGSELTGNGYIYDTVSTGKVCRVLGGLTITNTSANGALEIDSDIDLHFEFDHITGVRQAMYIAGTARVRIYGRFIYAVGDANGYGMSFRDTTNAQVTLTEGYEANHTALFFRGTNDPEYSGSCIFNSPYIKILEASPAGAVEKATVVADTFRSDAFIELNTNLINDTVGVVTGNHIGGLQIANATEVPGRIRGGIYLNGNIVSIDSPCFFASSGALFFDLFINGDLKNSSAAIGPIDAQLDSLSGTGDANIVIRGSKIIGKASNVIGNGRNYTFTDCMFYTQFGSPFQYIETATPSPNCVLYIYNTISESSNDFISGVPLPATLFTFGSWNLAHTGILGTNVVDSLAGSTSVAVVVPKN